ncbi:restriction modification system DNA specificity domain protein [Vibrio cincinnatiensis]|jgi:type I restriction enzyme S subunit|uniref:Type I restriction enzyme, S subunit n=1 Tax=Vibrio cincinnatiensis DSM 19608 TaxID=1123491 RepID=A0A1T4LN61_VIBCI|nr:restriction endonuclease subunit S [Vibrio cincinnatiensis]SJZ55884.1 type I restriction enzyme, S subunit [Vibrio cincinnatiensis DSM 19608]SUP06086.1 restriction modification system DNA specificity domain protein [Vibrio cincinnatiensis]
MSQSSFIDKLLGGVEVEWRALREVVKTLTAPAKLKRESYRETGKTPIIDQGEKFITGYTDEDVKALPLGEYVIFGDHSEYIKYVDFSFVQGADGLKILKSISDNPKYVYYAFLNFYQKELNYKRHWARASETLIPIPCPDNPEKSLAIQAEIVRILDAFTAMTAELTAELNMRKKQYNYYRDQLLSFDEDEVEWKALGKIAEINTGQKPSEILDTEAEFDYINAGTTRSGFCALSNCEGDTVTTPSRGQGGIGFVGYQNKSFWLGPLCYKIRSIDNKILINKYLFYILQSKNQLLLGLKKEGGVPAVNKSDLAKLEIPVPSITEQERIVEILDKFDTLATSIQEGLPREIELRQKQYEYYRDRLLSFPKPEESAA